MLTSVSNVVRKLLKAKDLWVGPQHQGPEDPKMKSVLDKAQKAFWDIIHRELGVQPPTADVALEGAMEEAVSLQMKKS